MRSRDLSVITLLVALCVMAGCVSLKRTPEARFFALRALADVPSDTDDLAQGGVVGVLPVRVPGFADRRQVVTWAGEDEIKVNEFVRWAEPLQEGVSNAITENLAILLPHHRILSYPWQGGRDMGCRVVVEVRGFGPHEDGTVRLVGRWLLLPPSGDLPLQRKEFRYERGPLAADAGAGTAVAAMNELLLDLASDVAGAIQALPYTSRELSVREAQ